jgi:hypothetical protein
MVGWRSTHTELDHHPVREIRTGPQQCRNLKSSAPEAIEDFLSMPPQPTPPILMRYEIRYCVV